MYPGTLPVCALASSKTSITMEMTLRKSIYQRMRGDCGRSVHMWMSHTQNTPLGKCIPRHTNNTCFGHSQHVWSSEAVTIIYCTFPIYIHAFLVKKEESLLPLGYQDKHSYHPQTSKCIYVCALVQWPQLSDLAPSGKNLFNTPKGQMMYTTVIFAHDCQCT